MSIDVKRHPDSASTSWFRKGRLGFPALLGVVIGFAAWLSLTPEPSLPAIGEYPEFNSVESLAEASGAVLLVEAGAVIDSFVDGPPLADGGIAMVMRQVRVIEALQGDAGADEVIGVATMDDGAYDLPRSVQLSQGERLVLFLKEVKSSSTEFDGISRTFITVSSDNGIFDVRGLSAIARSPVVAGLQQAEALAAIARRTGELPTAELFRVEIADLRAALDKATG